VVQRFVSSMSDLEESVDESSTDAKRCIVAMATLRLPRLPMYSYMRCNVLVRRVLRTPWDKAYRQKCTIWLINHYPAVANRCLSRTWTKSLKFRVVLCFVDYYGTIDWAAEMSDL